MNKRYTIFTRYRGWILLIGSGLLFWLWSVGLHYVFHEIPLGYDPGLYKILFEQMGRLSDWDWNLLSPWLQQMYPPFLGMVGASMMQFGWTSQGLVTRGAVGLSGLIVLSTTALAKRVWGWRCASVVFFLACSSFVLYQLFWRGYLKQMLGVVILVTAIHILYLKQSVRTYVLIGLLLAVGGLTQRPALLLGGVVGVVWIVSMLSKDRKALWGAVVACILLVSVGSHFWSIQIVPMIQPFLDAIDVPVYADGYKAGGTFLTMLQRLQTDWLVIITGLLGWLWIATDKQMRVQHRRLGTILIILAIRILAQFSFYQRMIGYLAPFLILYSGYILVQLSSRFSRYSIGLVLIVYAGNTGFFINRTRPPIINPVEYAMIQQIPDLVPDDAIIMVSGIRYSPRVRGRSGREVIAPGLFDYQQWGRQGEGWTDFWIGASGQEKCSNVANSFGHLNRPVYAWVGITQDPEDMNDPCITPVLIHPDYVSALYMIDYE